MLAKLTRAFFRACIQSEGCLNTKIAPCWYPKLASAGKEKDMLTKEMARQLVVRQAAQCVKNSSVADLFDGVASDAAANSNEAAGLLDAACL